MCNAPSFFWSKPRGGRGFFNQRRFSKLEAIIFASVIRGAKREPLEDPGTTTTSFASSSTSTSTSTTAAATTSVSITRVGIVSSLRR